jgi:hypothetical protein
MSSSSASLERAFAFRISRGLRSARTSGSSTTRERSKLPEGRTPLPTRPNRWRDLRVRLGVGNGLGLLPTMIGSMATRDFAAIHMM